ncbi:MAG: 50S ribosomal protein L5, partial [Sphaerochaeta sp.]|nr:50S ribosomal protein L5 [Sphaerochaeta sp.]
MAEEKNVQEAAPKKTAAPKKAEAKKPEAPAEKFVPNFKRKYLETVAPALFKEHGYKSPMQVPKLEKIVVSIGCGDAIENKKLLDSAVKELEQITGQHVVKTKARKSIANFKLREG